MISWLGRWVGRFTGTVSADIRSMVHWAVHAVASVMSVVFHDVGSAWHDVWASGVALYHSASAFASHVYYWLHWLVKVWIPAAIRWIKAEVTKLEHLALTIWHDAQSAVLNAIRLAHRLVDDALGWVNVHIWKPLHDAATWLHDHLIQWGYTAWWYITHPDQLVSLLAWPLVAWLERNAWDIAAHLGSFVLGLIARNMRRVALLLEEILSAIL